MAAIHNKGAAITMSSMSTTTGTYYDVYGSMYKDSLAFGDPQQKSFRPNDVFIPVRIVPTCASCGWELVPSIEPQNGQLNIQISPCPNCIEKAEQNAKTEGYELGLKEAEENEILTEDS